MQPRQLRVGDLVDDYCPRERRLSNHAVVALVGDDIRQVRCTTCDAEHAYKGGKLPPSRRKKADVAPPALAPGHDAAASPPAGGETAPAGPPASAPVAASPAVEPEAAAPDAGEPQPPSPHAEISLHRRLIRATLPRVESDAPARPIPEFTMHRTATGPGSRHGKPFRHGQGFGQQRHGKGGFGQPRHGQGEPNGNTFGSSRGGQGQRGGQGGHRGHGNPQAPRPPRHGFGRGPKKH